MVFNLFFSSSGKMFIKKFLIMHTLETGKAEALPISKAGGALVFSGKFSVFCLPSKKMSSVTSCVSVNCLIYVTIGYNVSTVNFICILWHHFVFSNFLQCLTQFLTVSHCIFNFSF